MAVLYDAMAWFWLRVDPTGTVSIFVLVREPGLRILGKLEVLQATPRFGSLQTLSGLVLKRTGNCSVVRTEEEHADDSRIQYAMIRHAVSRCRSLELPQSYPMVNPELTSCG